MPRARTVAETIAGEAVRGTPAERYADMLGIASVVSNRATITKTTPQQVVSVPKQFNAYGKALPAGTMSLVGMAERAIAEVAAKGPINDATFYATPERAKHIGVKGLTEVAETTGHKYFTDPQARAIQTSVGMRKANYGLLGKPAPPKQLASLPKLGPVPTNAPRSLPASLTALGPAARPTGAAAAIGGLLAGQRAPVVSARAVPAAGVKTTARVSANVPSLSAAKAANLASRLGAMPSSYAQATPTAGLRAAGAARVSARQTGLTPAQEANLASRLSAPTTSYGQAAPTAGARAVGAARVSVGAPGLTAAQSANLASRLGDAPRAAARPSLSASQQVAVNSRIGGFSPVGSPQMQQAASARPTTDFGMSTPIGSAFGAAAPSAGARVVGRASTNVVDGLTSGLMSDAKAANVSGRLNAAQGTGLATRAGAGIAGDASVNMGGMMSASRAPAPSGSFASAMDSLSRSMSVSPASAATMSAPTRAAAAPAKAPASTGFAGPLGSMRSQEASIAGPMAAARFAGPISAPTTRAAPAATVSVAAPAPAPSQMRSPRAIEDASMAALNAAKPYSAPPASFQTPAFTTAAPKIDALGQPPIPGLQRVAPVSQIAPAAPRVSLTPAAAIARAAPVSTISAPRPAPTVSAYASAQPQPTTSFTQAEAARIGAPMGPSAFGRVGSFLGNNFGALAAGMLGTAVGGPIGGLLGSMIGSRLQGVDDGRGRWGAADNPGGFTQVDTNGAVSHYGADGKRMSDPWGGMREAGKSTGKSGSTKSASTSSASKSTSGGRGGGIGPGGSGGRDPSNNK